jgi:acetate kinase
MIIGGHYVDIGETAGKGTCVRKIDFQGASESAPASIGDHRAAIGDMLELLRGRGVLRSDEDIAAIGHRIVHGGERYDRATPITPDVMGYLTSIADLAPLHNPIGLSCVRVMAETLPAAPQYAVFDTAFHRTIPEKIFRYGLPLELQTKFGIRKYGFHGTSHHYLARRASEIMRRDIGALKIVTCHLGNGQSLCAVKHGRSFDTSMGFTPLEGLPMGTRSGSFDPAIIFFLMEHGYAPDEIRTMINKKSGLLGISGIDSHYKTIEEQARCGDPAAKLASDMLVNRITCLIGAYAAEMGGVDAIVFSGGIGENSAYLRKEVLDGFAHAGLRLDDVANARNDEVITLPGSPVQALVIPANEELQIAREIVHARRGLDG